MTRKIFFSVSSTVHTVQPEAIKGLSEIPFAIYGVDFAITVPINFNEKIAEVLSDIEERRQSWGYKKIVAVKRIVRSSHFAPNIIKNLAVHQPPKSWIQLSVRVVTSDTVKLEEWIQTTIKNTQPPTANIELPFGLTFYVTAADFYPLVESRVGTIVPKIIQAKTTAATA